MAKIKLQKLQSYLQDVDGFTDPKLELEQYETTPHLAACMLHTIESSFGDIDGRLVADLGCGSGRLLIGAAILGAELCIGIDIDPDALQLCRQNVDSFDLNDSVDLLQMDVLSASARIEHFSCQQLVNRFDCVIMNPPFGTKNNKGIDMQFVRQALQLTNNSVYSLHKTATRDHIVKVASDWGATVQVLAEMRFDLPASYSFHRQDSKDIQVDLIRFTKTNGDLLQISTKIDELAVDDKSATRHSDKHKKHLNKKIASKSKR